MTVIVKKHQRFRFMASGMVTVFLLAIMSSTVMKLVASPDYVLWAIPVIVVTFLDLYFLTRSLLRAPKSIDTRLSTLIISIGATFGFSLVAVLIADAELVFPYIEMIKKMGRFLSLVPYPLVLWSLLCLKDCLTVVPEAHTVIAHGIYKYSRHPLYVCYIVWIISNVMMFPTLSMLTASVVQILFLMVRLKREEKLLLETFPEYKEYYKKTGLLGNIFF